MNAAHLLDTLLARPQARWFRDTASGGSALATGVVVAPQELQVLQAALAARQPVGEPVAVVGADFGLFWFGTGPIAPLVERHGLKPGSQLYAAPPAQAVGLGQIPHGIRLIEIPRRNNLDPINVFVQDYELGRGRIVVTCYGQAWCGFWGAMGERTVMQFVAACDADYVAGNMLSGRHEYVKKHERTYVERIATEVITEFRTLLAPKAVSL